MCEILLAFALLAVPGWKTPVVKLSFTRLGFGRVPVGEKSIPKLIVLTNIGNAPLLISDISISGRNAGDFEQINDCGAKVPGGISCTISITFEPSAIGPRTAILKIYDNAGGSPQALELGV